MSNAERIEELKAEIQALSGRLEAAKKELLEEQCAGEPRYERGTVVLVPRKLFGKVKMWPAKINAVNLYYASGAFRDGTPYETKAVSYSVYLQQKDGTFGGSSEGCYHSEVMPAPASEEAQ